MTKNKTEKAPPKANVEADIAIVGMACMFSGAPDMQTYWSNILNKVNSISEPDAPEWGVDRYLDADSDDDHKIYTKAGGFLRDLYRFNPAEFGIMPNSVDGQEPDQFLALKVASDALTDAGYNDPKVDHTNTGIILGHSTYLQRAQGVMLQHSVIIDQTMQLIRQLHPEMSAEDEQSARDLLKTKVPPFNSDTAPGVVPNVMTGRICNRLNFMGPNYIIDAACASSLLAVNAAMEELRRGRCDLMLAGGVNASIPAEALMVFTHLGGLSRSSNVRPFSDEADGTLLGEGLGVVVLKRLDDAQRDGDRVYAVLKSVGQSSDGRALGLLAPRLEGEILAVERAYKQANIDPRTVSLVEAHGTGIKLGDKTEITTLKTIMGKRDGDVPTCALGSVKSMISHCIPAAGVAGLIKTTLALHHKVLPPMLCDSLNPELGLDDTPFYINNEARPWIHRSDRPRRAAVNAFGFGGINTHAVLEEYADPAVTPPALNDWTSELLLFAAETRDGLIAQVERVSAYIAARGDSPVTLKDLAFTLTQQLQSGQQRLAIVCADFADLEKKLKRCVDALNDPDKHRLQTRTGLFFTDQPIKGKLAFVVPGEGAQYPEMLGDLAMTFPVVREWFDFWESIYQGERDYPSTSSVFPPPTGLSAAVREELDKRLHTLELGSESMFIASQAMLSLMQDMGLKPDAMLGHSSGENSVLVASGLVNLGDQSALREHILRLNKMYQEMDAAGEVVTGSLLTVGAVDRESVIDAVSQSGGKLHLALDNCHHQSVLFGPREDMDKAVERFRKEGGLCSYLPFDRAYHTSLFEPVSTAIEKFFEPVPFAPSKVPVYSCVNADLYPSKPRDIRRHAAIQWSSCVRFTETIRKMYDDGVRLFVEVGPAGNLTSFIDDILRSDEHVAVSVNNRNKSGLSQLQQTLGRVYVHGHDFDHDYLFNGREAEALDLDAAAPAAPRLGMRLANTMPFLSLDEQEVAQLRSLLGDPVAAQMPMAARAAGDEVYAEVQAPAPPEPINPDWPFIKRMLEHDQEHAVAEMDFDANWHRFIHEHVLYSADVSELDPDLKSLPVVPFTASLEMLAEVAGLIATQPCLTALENVRAYNWIALDEGTLTVRLEAKRTAADEHSERLHAELYDGDNILIEGDVIFSAAPLTDEPSLPELQTPYEPIWKDHELYTTGMFHGPMYHSVRGLIAWDEGGIDAEMVDTPVAEFFDGQTYPSFFINPVLMDAVGHLTAFWIAQSRGVDFSCFPSQIARIELLNPAMEHTAGCVMRGRMAFLDEGRFLQGDYDCIDQNGRAIFRITGWKDRFFSVPHSFYVARTDPLNGWYGEDWSAVNADLPEDAVLWHLPPFPAGFLEDAGAVWKRLLALTLLSREERTIWETLPTYPPQQRNEWLLRRIALKEVARYWLYQHAGVLLYPADIGVREDDLGHLYVAPEGLEHLGALPFLSVAYEDGRAMALASASGDAAGIDPVTMLQLAQAS